MKNALIRFCHAAVLIALTGTATAANEKAARIDRLLQQYHDLGQFSGAVLVADSGSIVLREGYGIANREWQIPNSPETRYLLGSLTKSFTAFAVIQMAHEGTLDLDAKISDYLPDYRPDTGSRISLRQLLTHTDGLPNYTADARFWQSYEGDVPYSTPEFVAQYCSGDLQFEPGSQYRYGNAGYSILGAIIESVDGVSYADAVARRILEPLDMGNTGQYNSRLTLDKRATGYEVSIDGYRPAAPVYKNLRAAGSMYSTVDDLLLYVRAMAGGGFVPEDVKTALLETREGTMEGTFAYGWNVGAWSAGGAIAGKRYIATNGEINGFNALLLHLPTDDRTIVLLNNTGETDLTGIAINLLRLLHNLEVPDPEPLLRDRFYALLRAAPAEAAYAFYREQRTKQPNDYLFFPWPMRIVAGQLMHEGRYDEAIGLLQLNLETNPGDSRSLIALAQAQAQTGDAGAAIASLREALSMDGSNSYAADLLRRLEKLSDREGG